MHTAGGNQLPISAETALREGWTFRGAFHPASESDERLRTHWFRQGYDAIEVPFTRKGKTLPHGHHAIWTKPIYNVQCTWGHIYQASPGSNLEKRCIARDQAGIIDALLIGPGECNECLLDVEIDESIEHGLFLIGLGPRPSAYTLFLLGELRRAGLL